MSPEFVIQTEEITVNGVYRLGINSGYVFMMHAQGDKPRITIGNDKEVDALWNENTGVCPYLDTYMIANCCLHSRRPIKVTLFRMLPVQGGR